MRGLDTTATVNCDCDAATVPRCCDSVTDWWKEFQNHQNHQNSGIPELCLARGEGGLPSSHSVTASKLSQLTQPIYLVTVFRCLKWEYHENRERRPSSSRHPISRSSFIQSSFVVNSHRSSISKLLTVLCGRLDHSFSSFQPSLFTFSGNSKQVFTFEKCLPRKVNRCLLSLSVYREK